MPSRASDVQGHARINGGSRRRRHGNEAFIDNVRPSVDPSHAAILGHANDGEGAVDGMRIEHGDYGLEPEDDAQIRRALQEAGADDEQEPDEGPEQKKSFTIGGLATFADRCRRLRFSRTPSVAASGRNYQPFFDVQNAVAMSRRSSIAPGVQPADYPAPTRRTRGTPGARNIAPLS